MLKLILNNPYRFLGVCSNAPTAERLANSRKLNAFLKVNRDVTFPLDLPHLMPALNRTADGMNAANNSINLPIDQLKHALFWFVSASPIDKMAIEYLQNGDTAKAKSLFEKKETFSSLINLGVLYLIDNQYGEAIRCITKVIHEDSYRESFVELICGKTFTISESDFAKLFIDALLEEIKARELRGLFGEYGTSTEDYDVLNELSIGEPIAAINSAIAQAKNVANGDADAQYRAGEQLMNSTKADLQTVGSILDKTNMQYQMVADNLAKQILQCGINYYNNTEEDDDVSVDKAMKLQGYALKIAVGKLTKDRCKENVEILKKKKEDLPPSEVRHEAKIIISKLNEFCQKRDTIDNAVALINDTKRHLQSMKGKLGASNSFYLKVSSFVVSGALSSIIEEVNSAQNLDPKDITSLIIVRGVLQKAWQAIELMNDLDMEASVAARFNTNKATLKNMCSQLRIDTLGSSTRQQSRPNRSTPPRVHVPTSTYTPPRTNTSSSSSSDDTNWGCIIWAIIVGLSSLIPAIID